MQKSETRVKVLKMILCALFAAFTSVCSQIAIPTPWGIPINLALLSVYVSGAVLGASVGALSQLVLILLAIVGAPVLQGFTGGVSIVFGITGGYILGYLIAAFIVGIMSKHFGKKYWQLIISMSIGCIACYLFGTIWYSVLTETGFIASLLLCAVPYLPGDAFKIVVAALISVRVYKYVPKGFLK